MVTKTTVRARRYKTYGGPKERLAEEVLAEYPPFDGCPLETLLAKMEDRGYVDACKCTYPPHKLDWFRRRLSAPHIYLFAGVGQRDGLKVRVYFPSSRGRWVSVFQAEQEAARDPEASDFAERQARFFELLMKANVREGKMSSALSTKPGARKMLESMASHFILVQQAPLLELAD